MRVWKRNLPAFALLLTGAVFLTIGILRGENRTVLAKAVRICLECIGIG